MNRAFMVAAVAALFNLTTLAPSLAAPVSSKAQQSNSKAVSKPNTTPTTNRFLTPRMMDRKRPMSVTKALNPALLPTVTTDAPANILLVYTGCPHGPDRDHRFTSLDILPVPRVVATHHTLRYLTAGQRAVANV